MMNFSRTMLRHPAFIAGFICFTLFLLGLNQSTMKSNEKNIVEAGIPSTVHFIAGQGDRTDWNYRYKLSSPFSFINYITLLAARRHLRPDRLLIHYYYEPDTFWWKQAMNDREINATLIKSRLIESVFNKTVAHHAHRSDMLRLEVLLEYGGIYLDSDVLTLRPFSPLLELGDVT
jgi:hypothetical protein